MTNFEEYQAETEKLEKRGIILAKELQERLIGLGVLPHFGRYFLEDILPKIMSCLVDPQGAFLRMLYLPDKSCSIILENGSQPSNRIEASSNCFVNAAGKFLIEAIERGFVKTNWQELLRIGLITSKYEVRSNLMVDRNLIKRLMENYIKKPETFLQKIKRIYKTRIINN